MFQIKNIHMLLVARPIANLVCILEDDTVWKRQVGIKQMAEKGINSSLVLSSQKHII